MSPLVWHFIVLNISLKLKWKTLKSESKIIKVCEAGLIINSQYQNLLEIISIQNRTCSDLFWTETIPLYSRQWRLWLLWLRLSAMLWFVWSLTRGEMQVFCILSEDSGSPSEPLYWRLTNINDGWPGLTRPLYYSTTLGITLRYNINTKVNKSQLRGKAFPPVCSLTF